MLRSVSNREASEKLEKLGSLQSQKEELRLHDKVTK